MPRLLLSARSASLFAAVVLLPLLSGCADVEDPGPPGPITLTSGGATIAVTLSPFSLQIAAKDGTTLLQTSSGKGVYGGAATTVDTPYTLAQSLPGWDGYSAGPPRWS